MAISQTKEQTIDDWDSMETPDKWVILKLNSNGKTLFKVLAGWSGSYLKGQSWRINSGIVKVESNEDHYMFYGHSGSVYKCRKTCYGMNAIMSSIAANFKGNPDIEIMAEQDFSNLMGAVDG
jgi:hypothetical protein